MPLELSRATPEQLAEAPELAALEILNCAAGVASHALLASSPELLDHDFLLEHANITPRLCFGAAVLSALDTLTVAVERYRVHLDQLASLRLRETNHSLLIRDTGGQPPAISTPTVLHREAPRHPGPAVKRADQPCADLTHCRLGRRTAPKSPGGPLVPGVSGDPGARGVRW